MARRDAFIDHLAEVPLFSGLLQEGAPAGGPPGRGRAGRRRARCSSPRAAAGTEFFVILDGHGQGRPAGAARSRRSAPAPFFGDLALLDQAPRNATVIAETRHGARRARPARVRRPPRRGPRLRPQAARRPGPPPPRRRTPRPSSTPAPPRSDRDARRARRRLARRCEFPSVRCRSRTRSSSSSGRSSPSALCSGDRSRSVARSVLVGHRAADHRVGRRLAVAREVFGNIPDAARTGRSTPPPRPMLFVVRVADVAAGPELRAGQARRPPHHHGERPPPHARLPRRRVDADAAARPGRRASCTRCIYFGFLVLFVATVVLEIDHQLPESLKFLHGARVPGVRRSTADVFGVSSSSASSGRSRAATSQRPYRIRIKTKPEDAVILGTFLVIGAHRLPHRGASASRSTAGPTFEKWSFVGYPLVDAVRLAGRTATLARRAPLAVGHPLRRVRRVPRDPAHHEAAAHDHVADEHVPEGQRTGPRAR